MQERKIRLVMRLMYLIETLGIKGKVTCLEKYLNRLVKKTDEGD